MISPRYTVLLTVAVSFMGCFDDARLNAHDGGDDLAPLDVPVAPPDHTAVDDVSSPDVKDAAPVDVALMDAATDVVKDALEDVFGDITKDAPPPDARPGECTIDRVLVGTSDYMSTGGYALGRFLPAPTLVARSETSPDQDHAPIESGCVVYDLLRGNDELAVLDPAALPRIARRIPLRPAMGGTDPYQANPFGVLTLSPSVAYVILYNAPRVAVVNPTMEGAEAVRRTIDLSPLRAPQDRDTSGAMEASSIVRAGRYVFVALQNLNAFAPVTNGTLAVIDPTGDILIDTDPSTPDIDPVRLSGRNPYTMRVTPGGRLVVSESGVLGAGMLDGGIEVVDPVRFTAVGLRITETQLGGDVSDFVMFDDTRGWALVRQSSTSSRVVEFNLDASERERVGRTIVSSGDLVAISRDPSGNVWVLDRSTGRAGARVFNTMGTEVTPTPLSTGEQGPVAIAFVP